MYQPSYIKIQNFGSIKDLYYAFEPSTSKIIQGKNLDDKGQKSNGVGKSSFNDAIAFSLTGISLRNISNEELIRDGENDGYLELKLISKDLTSELIIKRFLRRKKSQEIEIYLNGVDKHKDLPDVNSKNQFIIHELGISKDDLFQFFLITSERYKPYFKLSDNEKKNITSRFSNANVVDNVFPALEKDVKTSGEEIQKLKTIVSNTETKIKTYQDEIDNLNDPNAKEELKKAIRESIVSEQQYIENDNEGIKNINITIEKINKDIVDWLSKKVSQQDIDNKKNQSQELEVQYQTLEKDLKSNLSTFETKLTNVEKKLKTLREEISGLTQGITEITTLKTQIEGQLKTSIECPKCEHEFILDSKSSIDELKQKLKETEEILEEVKAEKVTKVEEQTKLLTEEKTLTTKIQSVKVEYKAKLDETRKLQALVNQAAFKAQRDNDSIDNEILDLERQITKHKQRILTAKDAIETREKKIVKLESDISNVDTLDNSDVILRYQKLIKDLQTELSSQKIKLTVEELELQRLNAWVLKFKSFKSYLANQSFKNIEDLTNFYLQKMNTDLSIEISAHLQKKKDVKEKMTETILRSGFPIGSHGRFSGGERGRIDMGMILANQTLINNNAAPKGLDFILIDEVMDSLDSLGIESIIKSMNNIDKILLLVTQVEINTLPAQTLTLVKRNNCTEIE